MLRRLPYSLVSFSICVLLGMAIGRQLKVLSDFSFTELLITFVALGFATILIHEFGHYLAGKALGFSCKAFHVFPFLWMEGRPAWKPLLTKPRAPCGYCMMVPSPLRPQTRGDLAFVIAGGPAANIASAGVLYASAVWLLGSSTTVGSLAVIWCWLHLAFAAVNLIPSLSGLGNDGDHLLATLRKKWFEASLGRSIHLSNLLIRGVRPRDLPCDHICLPETTGVADLGIAFYCAIDRGDYASASSIIARAEKLYPTLAHVEQHALLPEMLFWETFRGNREKARELREAIKIPLDDSSNGLRVLAYFHWFVEGDAEKAKAYREKAISLLDKYPVAGLVGFERDLLDALEKQLRLQLEASVSA